MTMSSKATSIKRVLFVVNEPGEFRELLKLADALSERGTQRCTFVFCRPDYVAYGPHSDICAARDYRSILVNPHFTTGEIPYYLHDAFVEDYIPTHKSLKDLGKKLEKPAKLLRLPNSHSIFLWKLLAVLVAPFATVGTRFRPGSRIVSMLQQLRALGPAAKRFRAMKKFIYALCRWESPDIIVYGQDYAGSFNSIVSLLANNVLDIPIVTLPFAMGTTKELNEALFYYPNFRADANRLSRHVAKSFPRWVNVYKGKRLLRLPPHEIIAAEMEEAVAPYPWLPYSGYSYFLAQSEQARDYYIAAGMDADRIKLTGSFNDTIWSESARDNKASARDEYVHQRITHMRERDEIKQRKSILIADAIASRIEREAMAVSSEAPVDTIEIGAESDFLGSLMTNPIDRYELNKRQIVASNALAEMALRRKSAEAAGDDGDQMLIIVSWPTNQFSRPVPGLEFENHEEVSRFWAEALRTAAQEHGAMVMVSLHPTLLGGAFSYLEDEFGFTIWPGSLSDILPMADVFVSCVSSTLLWAANLAVPSINYDCYRYGYREFDETGVIKTVSTKSDFTMILERILGDADFYQELKDGAARTRGYWGFFDGESEARIVAALEDIMVEHAKKPKQRLRTTHKAGR